MALLDGLATTRAIRRYRPEPIPEDALAQMLFAATRAPQGSNRQGFRFVVLREGLGMPADPQKLAIAATVPLGRPVGHHGPVRRRPLAEVVYEDGWEEP